MGEFMSELHLPLIDIPFPVRVSPHARYAEDDCRRWTREIGLVRDRPEARVTDSTMWSELAARVVPTAGRAAVVGQTRWLAWFGAFDDLSELSHHSPQEWDSVDHGIRDLAHSGFSPGTTAAHPLTRAFSQLTERMQGSSGMSDGWRKRFSHHLIELLDICRAESERKGPQVPLSIEEYVVFRRTIGYMPLLYDLQGILTNSDIPAELLDTVSYQSLQTLSIDAVNWINDIYSLTKEIESGQVQNIVIVISDTEKIPMQDALDEAAVRVKAVLEEFCAAEKEFKYSLAGKHLDAAATSRVERNIEGMRDWIVGPVGWYSVTARYQTAK
jgi:Terpene synthase family 2, C-terminal metal binding